jgi:nitrate/nitrite transport system substrate-binding protein
VNDEPFPVDLRPPQTAPALQAARGSSNGAWGDPYDADRPLMLRCACGPLPPGPTRGHAAACAGQAITQASKHKDRRDPKDWKGFRFAVPFDYSMHNFLLRYDLAEHSIHPDTDVQIRVTPPPEMVANLRAGNIDGFLEPDPFNQRAVYDEVGFIRLLSSEIWDGHPCCAFGLGDEFVQQNPNTFAALYRAVLNAAAMTGPSP